MRDLLRFCTAGSVDDGKSTLIGRLLYDCRALYDDQLSAVEAASVGRGAGPIDFSLFTDGLRAEREQGITIDVAYRYFSTPRRAFILADVPGHEQYTRNAATGASTSDVALLLVDARHAIRPQTRRHAEIARRLGISTFVAAVNKMDLIGFDRSVFDAITTELGRLVPDAAVHAVPISALHGDNVVVRSRRTPWFDGPTLLDVLETVDVPHRAASRPFRYPVQLVVRSGDVRGYAGRIVSGRVHVGDEVGVWPGGLMARVARITTWDGDLARASAPASITLVLDRDLDVGRGDLLASGAPKVGATFAADLLWMDERPLDATRLYILKQTTRTTSAEIHGRLDLNAIGRVVIKASQPLAFDRYADDRATGSFIVIDPATNFTAGAGWIAEPVEANRRVISASAARRIAHRARAAQSEVEAVEAVARELEDLFR